MIQAAQSTSQWSSMARIKPQDRQADQSTNVEIAMHVMGWTWQRDGWGVMAWFDHEGNATGYGAGGEWTSFKPSVDIAHAWHVLEHFTWPQFYTRLVRTETGNWRCDIELNGGDGPTRSAFADTAPLAICRAALAAVGV